MRIQRRQRRPVAVAAFIVLLALALVSSSLCSAEQEESTWNEKNHGNVSQENDKGSEQEHITNEIESNVGQNATSPLTESKESKDDSLSIKDQDDENTSNNVSAADGSEPLPTTDEEKEPTGGHDSVQADDSIEPDNPLHLLMGSEPSEEDGVKDTVVSPDGKPSLTYDQKSQNISHSKSEDGSHSEGEDYEKGPTAVTLENSTQVGNSDNSTNDESVRPVANDVENDSLNSTEAESTSDTNQNPNNQQERSQPPSRSDFDVDYLDLDDEIPKDPSTVLPSGSNDESTSNDETETGDDFIKHSNDPETDKLNRDEPEVEVLDAKTQEDETVGSDAKPTGQGEKHPKEESLASFFDKVKNKGQNSRNAFHDEASKAEAPAVPTSTEIPSEDSSDELSDSDFRYCNLMWGVSLPTKRYASLEILGETFHQDLVKDAKAQYQKIFEPADLVIPTLYSKIMAGEEIGNVAMNVTKLKIPPEGSEETSRSANAEFVEGLDDLDKFFEGVDPPDELDVGAAGTSIQEALMGQTSKIIIKKVVEAGRYVVKACKAIHRRASDFYNDEDRKIPKFNKEQFAKSGKWVVARGKDGFDYLKDLFQSLFQSDDEEGFADYASDLESRLKDLTRS